MLSFKLFCETQKMEYSFKNIHKSVADGGVANMGFVFK